MNLLIQLPDTQAELRRGRFDVSDADQPDCPTIGTATARFREDGELSIVINFSDTPAPVDPNQLALELP